MADKPATKTDDEELSAMARINRIVGGLTDPAARQRVLWWLNAKHLGHAVAERVKAEAEKADR